MSEDTGSLIKGALGGNKQLVPNVWSILWDGATRPRTLLKVTD